MADSGGSTGRGSAAASVGGSRTALARRSNARAGGATQGANSGRKAAGGGILKFYSDDAPGLKVGPTTVLVLSLVFMAIVCSLHILGKFRSG
ncbi:Sec61b [Symbiodinium sp. CCMP2592]|nr:Sec61b [Symbiodinium sp. CCMP2592]|eukprot:CAMPEP_0181413808 /NCGR_PEP_ID=MMETSP1110-20121109/9171_1 /TAXON_ID=174948 /ORGANISM="Symbiodinium sp., Strain CCMP421" /LENGTH=91 /DNA_ID=CAMNT_0023536649 /DNA_START=41 /DNA_END=316 /DNA_ORIENTATION=+